MIDPVENESVQLRALRRARGQRAMLTKEGSLVSCGSSKKSKSFFISMIGALFLAHGTNSFNCPIAGQVKLGEKRMRSASKHYSALNSITMAREKGEYDLIVIGGGPVGLTAGQSAAAVGRSTIIIDGTPKTLVQFTGPTGIFSKALRDTAKKIDVLTLRGMGLRDTVIWRQVQDMTFDVLRDNGLKNLRDMQVPHLRGNASFIDSHRVLIDQDGANPVELIGKKILIATGSTAYKLASVPYDNIRVFDSDTIKGLSFLPKSITIVGAGIIAVEYARIFSKLQCRVTMIVRQRALDVAFKRIGIDQEIAVQLQKELNLNKIRIIFNAQISVVEKPEEEAGGDRKDGRRSLRLKLVTADGKEHATGEIRSEVSRRKMQNISIQKGNHALRQGKRQGKQ